MSTETKRIAVLISGNGSNLQALIDSSDLGGNIVLVVSNVPHAYGLQRAAQAGIDHSVIDHKDYPNRAEFDRQLQINIDEYQVDLIVLAGFMRILTDEFIEHYSGRILNIHPSLLPKYAGLHTHSRALAAGDTEHGATVHFVTPELDSGPAIIQGRFQVPNNATEAMLIEKVHQLEHQIYPRAVQWFCQGSISIENQKKCDVVYLADGSSPI